MCGRFSLTADRDRVEKFTGIRSLPESYKPRYNISPGQQALLVRAGMAGADWARWGVPANRSGGGSRLLINARSETLLERSRFRLFVDRGRCVIPADGFYEWLADGRARIPFRITRTDRELFALAGLWEAGRVPEGSGGVDFTILTTRANGRIAPLHDRMPVILDAEGCRLWLDPDRRFQSLPPRLFDPCPADLLHAFTVSDRVNFPSNDTPDCVAPMSRSLSLPLL
jgi:putative SOS response-associated peptidase YedK